MSVFMQPLASYTVPVGNTGNLGLANIPATYTDLLVIANFRVFSGSASTNNLYQWFNNDASSLNTATRLWGFGSSTASNYQTATFPSIISLVNGAGSPANTFSSVSLYIPNYTSNFAKQFIASVGTTTNGTGQYSYRTAGKYANTVPINAIAFQNDGGGFVAGSTIDLYGILKKGV
jgi:hypothetical protein